jgi:uridine kinase
VRRTVVSIAGAAGSGKSQLALAVVALLGEDVAARVPMDWYIVPRDLPMAAWLEQPLGYDVEAVRALLSAPVGPTRLTPPFDFETFTRSETTGQRKAIPIRPVMVLDAMAPWPDADLSVLVDAPAAVRHRRIVDRDARWGSRVIDRWDHLELARRHIEGQAHRFDLILDGEAPLRANAARIVEALDMTGWV